MFGNFFKSIGRGAKAVASAPIKYGFGALRTLYRNIGIVPLLRTLPGFGTTQQVTCRARVPVIHKNQECQYVSSKCHKSGLEIQGKYLLYKGKRYPISPLVGSNGEQVLDVKGNKLFAINTAGTNNYSDFESKVEENKVLVVAYDGEKCVDPIPGRGSRKVISDFQAQVYPFSFSVVNHETKKTDLVSSLLMLPFNMSGLAIGCAGRLLASIIDACAKCCKIPARYLADKVDKQIIHTSSGVLQGQGTPYISVALLFVLSFIENILSATSCIVRNSANFSEAVVRFPSAIMNGIHNENMQCLAVKAGMAAIADPLKQCVSDMKGSSLSLLETCVNTKARLCANGDHLRAGIEGASGFIRESSDKGEQEKQGSKKKMSRADLEAVSQLGQDLASQIAYGTREDVSAALKRKSASSSKGM
ncbi:hypothetical protein [Ehrlichia ruminantium]|uniref:hypothetical protein n=1 Tax=Ehrlichia ruminantium TaxID=779 RepID=UPI0007A0457C|nr:hypothetical protein [Ehrlichia ruminantium]KYW99155.1 hypothetical protein AUR40_04815 [Ehrlichia ruminantium]